MNKDDNLLKFGDCIVLTTKLGYVQSQGYEDSP